MTRNFSLALTWCVIAAGASACAPSGADASVRVVASAYPLAWLTQEIAAGADVTQVAASGEDAHDAQLTPQEQASLQSADVVVHVGGGFQPQIEAAAGEAKGVVVAAVEVLPDDLSDTREHDPHIWFDPLTMGRLATAVADALSEANPEQADTYRTQGAEVSNHMQALATELDDTLATCKHREVVVGHEAYAHLLEPHGISQFGVSPAAGHSEATPQRISELVTRIRDNRIPAVLSEQAEGRRDAELVAREAGVEVIEIASLDIVSEEQAKRGYPDLLRQQARAVARAAECS